MKKRIDPKAPRLAIRMAREFIGTRTTLRLGRKWADRVESGATAVVLLNSGGGVVGDGTATRAAYLQLRDVPRSWLALDVDPLMKGDPLLRLRALYPTESVTLESLVSVLWFTRTR